MNTPGLRVEVAVATMDFYPYDRPGRPDWGSRLEAMIPFLQQTGCRNVELHPSKIAVGDSLVGDDEAVRNLVVGSLHQTFNEGGDLFGRLADRQGIYRSADSITAMAAIRAGLRGPVPAVHYPSRDHSPLALGTYAIVQPCPEVYRDLNIDSSNNQALIALLFEHGFQGLCPDTVHGRRQTQDGRQVNDMATWAGQFASGAVYEMHVSADRFDQAKRDPALAKTSQSEFQAFTGRRAGAAGRTQLGEMIKVAIANYVPPPGLTPAEDEGAPIFRQVLEIPPNPFAYLRRPAQHARFVESLADLIREAGAEPLLWNG